MGLNIPVLNSCCCMSLRTGTIITAVIQIFIFTLYFLQILIIILRYSVLLPIPKFENLVEYLLMEYVDILNIVFSVLLLIGILKESSGFVAAWLFVEVTRVFDIIFNSITTSFMYFHWRYFIVQLLDIGLEVICAWVGYSYYTTMPKKNKYIF